MASEQDISLVFGVQVEGSSDGPGSMKLISDQLSAIVDAINKEPFKIKFEADPASLEAIKVKLQEITNLTSKKITWFDVAEAGGTGSASYYIDDIVKSLGNMESTMKMTLDSSTHSFEIFQEQLIEVNRLLDIISRKELEVYNSYGGYGGGMTSDEAADLRNIAANIQMMYESLSELKQILIDISTIIQQINAKDFNITNKFSVEKMDNVRRELTLQREEMIELYNVTERYSKVFQDVVGSKGSNGVRAAMTSVTGGNDIYKMIYALENTGITLSKINKEKNAVNFDVMKRQLLELLNTYKNVLEYINAESDKKIDLPSLAALDDARAKLESFTETQDKYNQSMREATATAMGAKIDQGSGTVAGSGMGAVTNQVTEQVATMAGNVSTTLQDIKSQIESTFNISSFGFDSTKITEIFQSITTEFNSFKELVKAGIEELRQAAIEAFTSMTGKDGAFSSDSLKAYLKDLNEVSVKQAEIQKASKEVAEAQKQVEENTKSKTKEKVEEERSYALAISQRTKAQEDATKAEENEAKASEKANQKRKVKEITERQFLDIYRQIHAALRENASSEGSAQFEQLSKKLEYLDAVLQIAHDHSVSLESAFRMLGVTGLDALEMLKTNVSAFNLEIELTGAKGTNSAAQIYKSIAQMKTIVSGSKEYAGTETYDAIADRMMKFDQAIKMVETDLISVDSALEAVGITSADAMNGTAVLINKFKAEIAGVAKEEDISFRKAIDLQTRINNLIIKNPMMKKNDSYTVLNDQLALIKMGTEKAAEDTTSFTQAIKNLGLEGKISLETILTAISQFNKELSTLDTTSVASVQKKLNGAESLLNNNSKLNGLNQYKELEAEIMLITNKLAEAEANSLSFSETMISVGMTGKEAIDRLEMAIVNFNNAIINNDIITLEESYNVLTKAQAALRNNPGMRNTDSYKTLAGDINMLASAIDYAEKESLSLNDTMNAVFDYLGMNGKEIIGSLNDSLIRFNNTVINTDTTSITTAQTLINRAQKLLVDNPALKGSPQYADLGEKISRLSLGISEAESNSISLSEALSTLGITGKDAVDAIQLSIAKFNEAVINTDVTTLDDAWKILNKSQALLNNNSEFKTNSNYIELNKNVKILSSAINLAEKGTGNLDEAFRRLKYDGKDVISNINSAMYKLNNTIINTDTTSLKQAYDIFNKLQSAIKNNGLLTGTDAFELAEIAASQLADAIKLAEERSISIGQAFKELKYNSESAFNDANLALAKLNNAAINIDTTSIKDAYTLADKVQTLLSSNNNLSTMSVYTSLSKDVEILRQAIDKANSSSITLREAFDQMGYRGQEVIERITLGMTKFKDTMIQTGISGSLSVQEIENSITSMNNLLTKADKVDGMSRTVEYSNLESQILNFRRVLTSVEQDGLSVAEALRKIGENGTEFISSANDAVSKLKLALSSTAPAAKALADAEAKASKESKEYQTQLAKAFSLLSSMEDAANKWTTARKGKTSAEYSNITNDIASLKSLIAQYKSGEKSVADFKQKLVDLQNSFRTNSEVIRNAGENTKSFSDQVKNITQRFGAWFGVTRIIMYVYRTLRQMISASIELDDALTQLKIVTKSTDSVYSNFGDTIAEVAKRAASSVSDIVDSATVYARLGYSLEESAKIAEYTAMLQNVGDIEVSDAQNAITAILKAYDGIDANHIEDVMNKLITTGNGFPISVSQIAEGMNNASSALAAAGNTFEQSVALLTAANTTVQDAAKASTGLRTIAARIRRTDTELDELGESMTSAKYDELVKSLTQLDIALVDTNNEYRSTYDIMADIASKWDSMTSMEQSALAEAVAGTRQQAIFFSLIEQFQEASGAMDAMANSAGALDDAYSTYLDSTTAHINQFKASFQVLSSSLFDNKVLSFVVDLGRSIVDFATALQKVQLLIPGIISGVAAIKTLKMLPATIKAEREIMNLTGKLILNKSVTDELKTSIAALTIEQKKRVRSDVEAAITAGTLSETEGKEILATLQLTTAEEILESENQKLGISFKALGASIPFWGWISLISSVIFTVVGLTRVTQEHVNKLKELSEEYDDFESKIKDYKNAIEEIDTSMDTEAEKVQKLNDLRKEMEITYGKEIDAVNSTAEAHENLNRILRDEERQARLDYLEDTAADYERLKTLVEDVSNVESHVGFKNGIKGFSIDQRNVSEQIQDLFDNFELDLGGRKSSGGVTYTIGINAETQIEQYKEVKKVYDQLYKIRENRAKEFTQAEEAVFQSVKRRYEGLRELLYTGENGDVESQLIQRATATARNIMDANPQWTRSIEDWRELLIEKAKGDEFVIDAINRLIREMSPALEDTENILDGIISDLDRISGRMEEFSTNMESANKYFEDLAKVFKTNNDADKFFSASEIIELLEKYPELSNSILKTSEGYKIESDALEQLRETKLREQKDALIAQLQETYNLANLTRKRLEDYEKEIDGVNDLASAKIRLAEIETQIDNVRNSSIPDMLKTKMIEQLNIQKAQVNGYIQASEELDKYNDSIDKSRVQIEVLGTVFDEAEDDIEDATKALNEQKSAIKDLSDEYKDAQDAINDLIKLTMEMIKKQKELEKEALKEQLENYKKLIDKKKELIDLEKDQYEFEKDLKEQNKNVLDLQQELDALSVEGAEYSLEDMKRKAELQEKLSDAQQERADFLYDHEVDVRKDALDKEKEMFEDNITTQTKAIEDYLKHEGWIRQDAINLINSKTQEFYNDLYYYTLTYTTKSDYEFNKLWNDAYDALEKYGNGQIDVSAVLAFLAMQIEDCDNKIKTLEESINSAKNSVGGLADAIINKMGEAAEVTGILLDEMEAVNEVANGTQRHIPGTPIVSPGHSYWSKPDLLGGLKTYHSGGIVEGGSGLNRYTEVLAKLMSGEVVITPNQAKTFMSKTLPTLSTSNVTNNQMSPTISIGDINISGNADSSTVSQLKEIQKEIVDSVFKAVNGQRNLYNGGKVRMA